jgi:hypothetical protein
LPRPGRYHVQAGRSVVELAARLGPLSTLRSRLALDEAELTVSRVPVRHALRFTLDAGSAQGRSLRGRRGLNAERHPVLSFASAHIKRPATGSLLARGELRLRDAAFAARLRARIVECDEDRLLLLGTLTLPYRELSRATGFRLPPTAPAHRLRLLFAAEFTEKQFAEEQLAQEDLTEEVTA